MRTKNKNVTISDRLFYFIFDSETISGVGGLCLRATTKKGRQIFWGKKCIRWPGLIPRNDLAAFLRWRLHLMTCLMTLVTWKWPGCFDLPAPPLNIRKWAKTSEWSLRVRPTIKPLVYFWRSVFRPCGRVRIWASEKERKKEMDRGKTQRPIVVVFLFPKLDGKRRLLTFGMKPGS